MFTFGLIADRLTEDILDIEGVGSLIDLGGNLGDVNIESQFCQCPGDPVKQANRVMRKDINDGVLPGHITIKFNLVREARHFLTRQGTAFLSFPDQTGNLAAVWH